MKSRRFKTTPRDSASSGHTKLFGLLQKMFPNHIIYQEYPYHNILKKGYKIRGVSPDIQNSVFLKTSKRLFADIFDNTLNIIYEYQGAQHYEPIIRTKQPNAGEIAVARFHAQKRTDLLKRDIAVEIGFRLIEIPYTDYEKIDEKYIWSKLEEKD